MLSNFMAQSVFSNSISPLQKPAAESCTGFSYECNVHWLLLPASAEGPVKLHEALALRPARLRQRELSGKE